MSSNITYSNSELDEATKCNTSQCFALLGKKLFETTDLDRLTALLAAGIDIEARDNDDGWTPLYTAAYYGRAEAMRLLLAASADKDARDKWGETLLQKTIFYGHTEAVRLLLVAGADKDARDNNGWTPLHVAANYGKTEALRLLLAAGADKDVRTSDGQTPLHHAARNGHTEALQLLLAAGANVYRKDNDDEAVIATREAVEPYQECYNNFIATAAPPKSVEEFYQILSLWPLTDPYAPVDSKTHLQTLFAHARWESPEQAIEVIEDMCQRGEDPVLCDTLKAMVQPHQHSRRLASIRRGR